MKKILVFLSLLALVAGFAFAKTCGRCGTEYYGSSCPYCKGYSLGMQDKYTGSSSSSQCNNGDYYSPHGSSVQQKRESSANCYEGYNDAMSGNSSKGSN